MKRNIYILSVFLLLANHRLFGQSKFSIQQLTEDLIFYKSKLERYHPNLYLYHSKEKIDFFFDSLICSFTTPLSEAEFYQTITLTSNLIKDGHTLILPSNSFVEFHNSHSTFIPLQIGLSGGQLYVKMNCTPSLLIEDGTIIDSINGVSSEEITKQLFSRQVRDGNNLSYSNWIIDRYFREYYSYTFGHPDIYKISFVENSLLQALLVPSLVKDSIYYYRQNNYPALFLNSDERKGIYLDYDGSLNTGILTIKDFHSEVLKSAYNQDFSKEIKSIFDSIFLISPQNLVIDLRDNQGGDVENGVLLLSYLIHQPFKVVEEYNRMKKGKIVRCKGPSSGYHKPNKNQFTGQIYVIINGGSFSNSAIVSSCLKEHTNAIFVGTETGGNPNILAGYTKDYELPNTKIRVEIPTKQFILTSLQRNDGNGLIPTYEIENSIQDHILQNDRPIDYILKLIEESNKSQNKG